MRKRQGKIKQWDDVKGFGFIKPESGDDLFFHVSSYQSKSRPEVNQQVKFDQVFDDKRKRFQAVDVRLINEKIVFEPAAKTFVFSVIYLGVIYLLSMFNYLPALVFWAYLIVSLLTFFFYGWDKLAAKKSWQRTPEVTLHYLSLMCGWPGAVYAQQLFRHKSIKRTFRRRFCMTVVVNLMALLYLLSPYGHWLVDKLNQINVMAFFR